MRLSARNIIKCSINGSAIGFVIYHVEYMETTNPNSIILEYSLQIAIKHKSGMSGI